MSNFGTQNIRIIEIIELYKMLTGKYGEEVSNFLRTRDDSTTRGHKYKLYKTHSSLDVRKYSFTKKNLKPGTTYHPQL